MSRVAPAVAVILLGRRFLATAGSHAPAHGSRDEALAIATGDAD